jgi:hypothetical protein
MYPTDFLIDIDKTSFLLHCVYNLNNPGRGIWFLSLPIKPLNSNNFNPPISLKKNITLKAAKSIVKKLGKTDTSSHRFLTKILNYAENIVLGLKTKVK